MRWPVVLVLALLAGGCASGEASPTVAGPAEHTVGNVDAACLRERLRRHTVGRGFVVRSSDEHRLVAARTVRPIGPSLFSTRPMEIPEERILLTLTPLAGNGLRVGMRGGFTTISGTGFEGVTPVDLRASDVAAFSAELDRMAAACPATPAPDRAPRSGPAPR